jgi:hypothetical protein
MEKYPWKPLEPFSRVVSSEAGEETKDTDWIRAAARRRGLHATYTYAWSAACRLLPACCSTVIPSAPWPSMETKSSHRSSSSGITEDTLVQPELLSWSQACPPLCELKYRVGDSRDEADQGRRSLVIHPLHNTASPLYNLN